MKNADIKTYAKKCGVYLYELADGLGIADTTLSKWLRKEFDESRKNECMKKIDEIAEAKGGE